MITNCSLAVFFTKEYVARPQVQQPANVVALFQPQPPATGTAPHRPGQKVLSQ
ncbi:hypothetical protein [Noviherbaspirillum galbum]|uniref:Uncharacterized protein n=1 Tax=Noviherbaspirillum galbum TaxID=2709383 RepID=A0A6B3SRL8_9BURK|nr:hypothetical protein [Noviherbaspirillum galbum]NEX63417.1 hypothetical protein [Noviherbaspirillum galbum]